MKKLFIVLLTTAAVSVMPLKVTAAADFNIGFVNFKECLEKSKVGQQEKNAFESLKKQMSETVEKADKELAEIAKKLEDQDYMDGLSPAAEDELKQRFQYLSQEMARYQNQYYQILNQANFKLIQSLHDSVSQAAEKVRVEHNLSMILNEDSTFALAPALDYTAIVIDEMDKRFAIEKKLEVSSLDR